MKRGYFLGVSIGIALLIFGILIGIFALIFSLVKSLSFSDVFASLHSSDTAGVSYGVRGCYLIDSAFKDTSTVQDANWVIQRLKPTYNPSTTRIQQIITECKKAGINPAIIIAIWAGEQSFGAENKAFGCGVYGGRNRYPGFENQLNCAIDKIKKAINNQDPYNKPVGSNIFTRLFYNYTGSMQETYKKYGYVAGPDNARIVILKRLVPNQVVCEKENQKDEFTSIAGGKILNVPCIGEDYPAQCGVASVCMVIAYMNKGCSSTSQIAGSQTGPDLQRLLNQHTKISWKRVKQDINLVKKSIDSNYPVVVYTGLYGGKHIITFIGYDQFGYFYLNDPNRNKRCKKRRKMKWGEWGVYPTATRKNMMIIPANIN